MLRALLVILFNSGRRFYRIFRSSQIDLLEDALRRLPYTKLAEAGLCYLCLKYANHETSVKCTNCQGPGTRYHKACLESLCASDPKLVSTSCSRPIPLTSSFLTS